MTEVTLPSVDAKYITLFVSMYETQSVNTAEAYAQVVRGFVAHINKPLAQVTVGDIIEYQKSIAHLAVSTQRRMLSTLKSLYKFLSAQPDYLVANPFAVYKLPKEENNDVVDRVLSHDEIELIRSRLRRSNVRDYLIVSTLYTTGLRVSELTCAKWNDTYCDVDGNYGLRVVGKGNKVRHVKLQPALYNALLGYRTNIGLSADDTLFVNRYGNAIDKRSIEKMVRAAAKSVGINKPVTPHWFRHSAGTSALYNGANIHQVQQMLGHSSVATTNAYLHSINKLRDSATDFIKVDM